MDPITLYTNQHKLVPLPVPPSDPLPCPNCGSTFFERLQIPVGGVFEQLPAAAAVECLRCRSLFRVLTLPFVAGTRNEDQVQDL